MPQIAYFRSFKVPKSINFVEFPFCFNSFILLYTVKKMEQLFIQFVLYMLEFLPTPHQKESELLVKIPRKHQVHCSCLVLTSSVTVGHYAPPSLKVVVGRRVCGNIQYIITIG